MVVVGNGDDGGGPTRSDSGACQVLNCPWRLGRVLPEEAVDYLYIRREPSLLGVLGCFRGVYIAVQTKICVSAGLHDVSTKRNSFDQSLYNYMATIPNIHSTLSYVFYISPIPKLQNSAAQTIISKSPHPTYFNSGNFLR
jgi:hypothetical protein